MPDIKIKDPKVGDFVMPWGDDTRPPSSAEIDDYIVKNVAPKPKESLPVRVWDAANKPMFPEVKGSPLEQGQTEEEARYRVEHPVRSFITDAGQEMVNRAYDKVIRPMTSPVGLGITAATTMSGIPELAPYVKPLARVGLGAMAAKGAYDAKQPLVKAYNEPTGQNISDAGLAVAGPIAMGAGAFHLGGPSVKVGEVSKVTPKMKPEIVPEPMRVNIPEGVKIQLRPGFEDALGVDEGTRQVYIKDMDKFREGVSNVDGSSKGIKQLSADLKAATPSTDYNEGYNPDAVVASHVSGEVPTKDAFASWVNSRNGAKWTGQQIGEAFKGLDEKYNTEPTIPETQTLAPEAEFAPVGGEGDFNSPRVTAPQDFQEKLLNNVAERKGMGITPPEVPSEVEETEVGEIPDKEHPLVQLQDALKNGEEPELERYMNQLHEETRRAGVQDRQLQLGYKEDYLPQMWDNTAEEVSNAFKETRRIGIKPSFAMKRVFEDYRIGIERGLTPKFEKPSELLSSYASYVDKFVADKNFFDQLKTNGLLKTRNQLAAGEYKTWEALDPKRTPVQRFEVSTKEGTDLNVTREYYAPKQVAKAINEYLQGPDESSILNKIQRGFGQVKSLVMTSGIPGTALNIHGTNVGVGRMWQAGGAEMVGRYLKYAVNPKVATEFTRNNLYDAPRFVRAGLKFNPEFTKREVGEFASTTDRVLNAKHNLLERPLFGQVIPALQLELAQTFEKGYIQRNVEASLATKLAAHDANSFVSNINYDELMRQREIRDLGSALSFAPSWLESHGQIAKGVVKALLDPKDPKGYVYRQAAGQALKGMLAVGLINKMTTGKFDPLTLHVGKDSAGKDMTVSPFGSGDDWLKIPIEIAQAAASGKPFEEISNLTKGRLASPLQFAVDFLAKQKAQGGDLLRDRRGSLPVVFPQGKRNSQLENLGDLAVHTMAPGYVGSSIDAAKSQGSGLKVAADLVGAQVRTHGNPRVKRQAF